MLCLGGEVEVDQPTLSESDVTILIKMVLYLLKPQQEYLVAE